MKKPLILLVILIVLGAGAFWYSKSRTSTPADTTKDDSDHVSVSDTVKISSTLSEYKNAELGFSVKYPNTWEYEVTNSGVTFIIPIDQKQVSTVATLQANVQVVGGTCAFPPVTTIKERKTETFGSFSFNMISMSNTVQGRNYFNRMYSFQKDKLCYMFSFASITQSPASKSLTGSAVTQAENNNKAIIDTADKAFTDMVKSFSFVAAPKGQDETQVKPPVQ